MFFFFAGSVGEQAGRVLKKAAGHCIRCGSAADLVETDKVLKLFFVPVYRWHSSEPSFLCRECSFLFPHNASAVSTTCRNCSGHLHPSYRFCPFCGTAL